MNDKLGEIASEDREEQRTRAQINLEKAKEKDKGKVAVNVRDKVNTILIVPPERKETAVEEFLERTVKTKTK